MIVRLLPELAAVYAAADDRGRARACSAAGPPDVELAGLAYDWRTEHASTMTRRSRQVLGHYRVGRLIGAGGMGEVYDAEDLQLGRRVALKVLPAEVASDRERLARFTREARALAALNHPGIVTIYSVDECDGEHFLTMELVEGRTLAECIPAAGMATERFLDLAIPLADALAAAHERGIVHRDLKPTNVMVTGEGRVKVLDFGLAKLLALSGEGETAATLDQTQDGALLGTLPYMSPEQLAGRPADARSDLFSLGVVLYEMVGGRHPFHRPTAAALILAVMHETPTSLAAFAPGLPDEIARLIARCMEKDPSQRPGSAAEVRAALETLRRGPTALSQAPWSADVPRAPSVAVLPFADMSPAKDQEYFCDGIAEEILNALAQLEGLRVTARTSSFAFKGRLEDVREIGRQLGVGAVLEGSVRKAGERLRITVQLIDVVGGFHLWSERYDRGAEDIFAIQDEISLAVVEKLKVRLLDGEACALARRREPSQEAYHLCLKGRYFFHRRGPGDLQRAIECFEKAIVADPEYAEPHLGIAEVFNVLGTWDFLPARQAVARAKKAAERAIELDDSRPEAHLTLAFVHLLEWDWTGAERRFQTASRLTSRSGFGRFGISLFLLLTGHRQEALEAALRTVAEEPLSPIAYTQAGAAHIAAGDIEGAVALLDKSLELDGSLPMAQLWMGYCRAVQGRLEEAAALLQSAVAVGLPAALVFLPRVLVLAGREDEARSVVAGIERAAGERYVSPLVRACAHAALGDRARSVSMLEQAEAERSGMMSMCIFGPGYLLLVPDWVLDWFADCRNRLGLRSGPVPTASGPRG